LSYGTGYNANLSLSPAGSQAAVLFDLPAGWSCANVLAARFFLWNTDPQGLAISFPVHVYDATLGELTPPGTTGTAPTLVNDWVYVYFSGITVTGEFYVSIETPAPAPPARLLIRFNSGPSGSYPDSHSYWGTDGPATWGLRTDEQFTHLQTEVEQCPAPPAPPVGGFVTPVNTFAVLAPWLAVIGLVGCVGTAVVVVRKRQS
jgi:hypothetical protein